VSRDDGTFGPRSPTQELIGIPVLAHDPHIAEQVLGRLTPHPPLEVNPDRNLTAADHLHKRISVGDATVVVFAGCRIPVALASRLSMYLASGGGIHRRDIYQR
jgi:hypothetical protein